MKKNGVRAYILLAIAIVLFSAVSFLPPFTRNGVFTVAYIFGLVAILSQIYFMGISFSRDEGVRSKFYGFPIAQIGAVYLIVQIIVSIVEMILSSMFPLWAARLINILLMGVAFVGGIASDTMRDEIERQDTVRKRDVSAMRELQSLANAAMGQCSDDSIKKELKTLSEELKYSDPVSSEATAELEKEMLIQLKEIQTAALDGDAESVKVLSGKLLANLTERNRICKLSKQHSK